MIGWMSTLCFPNNRGKWEGLEDLFCAIFNSQEVRDELFPLYYFVKRKISERDGISSALAWLQVCGGRRDGWEEERRDRRRGGEVGGGREGEFLAVCNLPYVRCLGLPLAKLPRGRPA